MPGVKTSTSSQLGALLLKGWAMLAENCPDCQVPLMKPRDSEERLCVNCNTNYVPDGQGLRPTTAGVGAAPAASSSSAAGGGTSGSAGARDAGAALLSNGAAENGQLRRVSSESEDGAQNGTVAGGARHAGEEDEDEEYNPHADPRLGPFSTAATTAVTTSATVAQSSKASAGGTLAGTAASSSGRVQPQHRQEEDVADLLSAKMLQGWALLDKYCPRCSTVLVRSKATKQMFCVACDAWVVPEGERPHPVTAQPQPAEQAQSTPVQEQHKPAVSASATEVSQPLAVTTGVADANPRSNGASTSSPPPQVHQVQAAAASAPAPAGSAAMAGGTSVTHTGAGTAGFLADVLGAGAAAGGASGQQVLYSGYESSSRGSSPPPVFPLDVPFLAAGVPPRPQQQAQHHPQQHQAANATAPANAHTGTHPPGHHLRANFAAGLGAGLGSGSGGKSPAAGGNAMLLSVSRTVALKMTEAQQQLERISVLELDRARGLVGFISECLDLLAKLHRLQAQ